MKTLCCTQLFRGFHLDVAFIRHSFARQSTFSQWAFDISTQLVIWTSTLVQIATERMIRLKFLSFTIFFSDCSPAFILSFSSSPLCVSPECAVFWLTTSGYRRNVVPLSSAWVTSPRLFFYFCFLLGLLLFLEQQRRPFCVVFRFLHNPKRLSLKIKNMLKCLILTEQNIRLKATFVLICFCLQRNCRDFLFSYGQLWLRLFQKYI